MFRFGPSRKYISTQMIELPMDGRDPESTRKEKKIDEVIFRIG